MPGVVANPRDEPRQVDDIHVAQRGGSLAHALIHTTDRLRLPTLVDIVQHAQARVDGRRERVQKDLRGAPAADVHGEVADASDGLGNLTVDAGAVESEVFVHQCRREILELQRTTSTSGAN